MWKARRKLKPKQMILRSTWHSWNHTKWIWQLCVLIMTLGKTKKQRDKKGGIIVFLKMRNESSTKKDCIFKDEGTDIGDAVKNWRIWQQLGSEILYYCNFLLPKFSQFQDMADQSLCLFCLYTWSTIRVLGMC